MAYRLCVHSTGHVIAWPRIGTAPRATECEEALQTRFRGTLNRNRALDDPPLISPGWLTSLRSATMAVATSSGTWAAWLSDVQKRTRLRSQSL
eukprot:scaffold569_cov408-Prasinococcus_capsulatus_cf.AAC.39